MIHNQILLSRICKLISMTYAVPYEQVWEDAKTIGIEEVIEKLENLDNNKPKY
jgi:hypothetical protein